MRYQSTAVQIYDMPAPSDPDVRLDRKMALIVSAIVWGFGANSSNPHLASRGKIGVLVSCGAAVICGASVTLINFFWNVGQSV